MSQTPNPTLAQLLAAPVELPLGTRSVMVRPMGWYQGFQAVDALLPVIDELPMTFAADGTVVPGDANAWLEFVTNARDEIASFCALASGQARDEICQLQPTLLVELLTGLLEINVDFFVQSLPALAQRVAGRLVAVQAKLMAAMQTVQASITSSPS